MLIEFATSTLQHLFCLHSRLVPEQCPSLQSKKSARVSLPIFLRIVLNHYTTQGDFPQELISAWQAVWKSNLQRSYTSDFELYPPNFDPEKNPETKVYIAIER